MDLSDLKEILRILEEQDITEFELEQDGVKLRVCRSSTAASAPGQASIGAPVLLSALAPLVVPASAAGASAAANAAATPAEILADGTLVPSPIVGTFYSSPDPN